MTGSVLKINKADELPREKGAAVVELAVCLPLLLLTILAAICLLEAVGRRIVVERVAAAAAVAAIGEGGRSADESGEIALSRPGVSVSYRNQRLYLPEAPEGLREPQATMVTAESGADMVGIVWRPLNLALRGSYVVVQAPRY